MTRLIVSSVIALTFALDGVWQTAMPRPPAVKPNPQAPAPQEPKGAPPPSTEPGLRPADPSGSQQPSSEAELKQLVVMIRGKLEGNPFIGSGVIVGQRNDRLYIATANHVVRTRALSGDEVRAEEIQVQLFWLPGESTAATLLNTFDETLDLAVLAVPGANGLAVPRLSWAVLVRPDALTSGERVVPVGNPLGEPWFVPRQPHLVSRINSQTIETEGDMKPGNSGGPLTTDDWGIVGLVRRESGLLKESTRIDLVVEQLARWKYPVDATFKTHKAGSGGSGASMALSQERQAAEKLAGDWVRAMIAGDVSTLFDTFDTPFYFDNEILVGREDVKNRFTSAMQRERNPAQPAITIQRIKARTGAEAKAQGLDLSHDRFGNSLSIADNDWIVEVITGTAGRASTDGTAFFIRNVNGTLKLVGFWN